MTISVLSIMFAAIVSQNIVLSQYQGICPFLGVSKKMSSAVGMGFAVIFVMAISAVFTWLIYNFILLPLEFVARENGSKIVSRSSFRIP